MCGRYFLFSPADVLKRRFHLEGDVPPLQPHYNIAPSQDVPVIFNIGGPSLRLMRWGLVPARSEDPSVGIGMINARVETAASKESFRGLIRRQRALVPVDGFYEWRADPKRGKVPYAFRARPSEPFGLAGLWDRWKMPDGRMLFTFTILTTAASRSVAFVHDRMPVVLRPEHEALWLNPRIEDPASLTAALAGSALVDLEATEVLPAVNSVRNDSLDCLTPARPA